MTTRGGRATLAAVADAAGVSIATVSKVVNARPDVAPDTRARIEQLLQEYAYRPRRGERQPRTAVVALLFHGPLTTYSLEILEGVLAAASEVGVEITVSRTDMSSQSTAGLLRERSARDWPAVIAVPPAVSELAALTRAHLPTVVIDPIGTPGVEVISVGSTNFAGGLAATQHLLDLGHRNIAYLGGTPGAACNQARLQGYRGALEAAGVRIPKGYVHTGRFMYEDGLLAGSALLDLAQPPTAVFAANDEMALGILEAARTRGVRVPQDLSVVGFDDTEVARVSSPPLTTVAQPLRRMGTVALRTALRVAAGEHIDSHHVELATGLVVRESTAPVRMNLTGGRRRTKTA